MKIIGNKKEFAVEYKIINPKNLLGFGKLWIQNSFYGTSNDLIYLDGYLVSLIEDMLNADNYPNYKEGFDNEKLFQNLEIELNNTSKYLITSSTFTDDFLGFKFKLKDEIILIWKIISNDDVIFEDLRNYSKSVIMVKFNYVSAKLVLSKLKKQLEMARV